MPPNCNKSQHDSQFREYTEQVRELSPIEEIAGKYTDLKLAGKALRGICPLPSHYESEASFTVYAQTQSFYCFGCHRGGDVFTLMMLCEGTSFIEALNRLGQRAGIKPPHFAKEDRDKWEREESERRRLQQILTLAADYYHSKLTSEMRSLYQRHYGFTDETIDELKLGYADGTLISHLVKERKLPINDVISTGLAAKTREGIKDFFVGRLMFPY